MQHKRIQPFFKLGILLLSLLFVCTSAFAKQEKISIVTSFYPLYIMALNVADGIDGVQVENLTQPTAGCLHDYTLTPQEMKKLEQADIFIVNGAGMESFLERVAGHYPKLKIVPLSQGIKLIQDAYGRENPHVWVSISGAIAQVRNLSQALEAFDTTHQQAYRRNTELYTGKLQALLDTMKKELAPFKGSSIITFHEAFPYFAKEFELSIAAVVEREPASAPSAKELAETIRLIKQTHIKALFSEPQYPALTAQAIARETGLTVSMLDPCVTGPLERDAYIEGMKKNLSTLKRALQ